MPISNVANDFMIDFLRPCRLFFGNAMMASLGSLYTASTCCVGLGVRRRQCCGKRLKDQEILWPPVSGTKNFMVW